MCIYQSRYHHHHTNYVHLCNNIEEGIDSSAPYDGQFPQKCVQCIQAIQSALPNVQIIHYVRVKFIINAGKSMFAPCAIYECTGFSC